MRVPWKYLIVIETKKKPLNLCIYVDQVLIIIIVKIFKPSHIKICCRTEGVSTTMFSSSGVNKNKQKMVLEEFWAIQIVIQAVALKTLDEADPLTRYYVKPVTQYKYSWPNYSYV